VLTATRECAERQTSVHSRRFWGTTGYQDRGDRWWRRWSFVGIGVATGGRAEVLLLVESTPWRV
jgi:hypothetical protein